MPMGVKEVQSQRPRNSHQARRKNTEAARDGLRGWARRAGACAWVVGRAANPLLRSTQAHLAEVLPTQRLKESNYVSEKSEKKYNSCCQIAKCVIRHHQIGYTYILSL